MVASAIALATPSYAESASDPRNPVIPPRYLDQTLTWAPCDFDAEIKKAHPQAPTTNCATVMVPMDWHNPDAHPDIKVAIAYSKATGPVRGLLTSNPGGPGGAGLNRTANLAVSRPQMFRDFDLLGFDPRGFGRSEALRCLTTRAELNALPKTPDYRMRDERTHRAEIAEAALQAKACTATEFGQFVSSQQTVYDMEFLRALSGHRLLHFIGYSYGTWLGGWYADTYPQRVGRFVLDSNMDWTHSQWDNINFDPWSYQRRFDTQFKPWIARHADQITGDLGTAAQQVQRTYDSIRGKLTELQKTTNVRPDDLDNKVLGVIGNNRRFIRALIDILVYDEFGKAPAATIQPVHVERAWGRLAPALQAFDKLADVQTRYAPPRPPSAGEVVNLGALSQTVRCNDTAWSKDPRFYTREADRMANRYPWGGYLNGVPMCTFWPYQPQDRKLDLKGAPRMLMVHSEIDPQTAYEGAIRTYKDITHASRLVSIDDEGQHGQYILGPSSCVQQFGDRFLFNGELPGRNEICGTAPLPEDGSVYEVKGPLNGKAVPLPRNLTSAADTNPMLQDILDQMGEQPMRPLNR
ncbi:alpha/beta hydrolase [Kibdelosporangium philippinense]|uniref:Alpha/beta hydrolase n=1 Tax=Kibdelosporangium philippinense TaxID=211113 RepID=A0ABS8ZFW8_9PSEU|nr:alpha/beta hydrolase [Kibdelosporangium philippinense]MCE7006680.1 alpha/beta hydrolase [Kibdelosporangium philippinense]